ncbi:peroxidase [bacterium]|nr:MAG: peroxidase [bacterium]
MTWIKTIEENAAEGKVKELYEGFKKQVGFVPNIIKLFSIKPRSMEATSNLFKLFMYGPSPLSRAQREATALVVSVINQCHY